MQCHAYQNRKRRAGPAFRRSGGITRSARRASGARGPLARAGTRVFPALAKPCVAKRGVRPSSSPNVAVATVLVLVVVECSAGHVAPHIRVLRFAVAGAGRARALLLLLLLARDPGARVAVGGGGGGAPGQAVCSPGRWQGGLGEALAQGKVALRVRGTRVVYAQDGMSCSPVAR